MTELGADGMNASGQVGMKYMMRGMSLFTVVIAAKLPAVEIGIAHEIGAVLVLVCQLDSCVFADIGNRSKCQGDNEGLVFVFEAKSSNSTSTERDSS